VTRYIFQCPVRWSDLDAYGHVNNARYLTYLEEARVAMIFTAASEQGVSSFEQGMVIARHEIDYLRPVDYTDQVRIEMWVENLRAGSFTIAYEIFNGDEVACRAQSVCVPFDLAARAARRLTEEERAYLKPWLA
jgi:acyl-CoA thioester hydrolase